MSTQTPSRPTTGPAPEQDSRATLTFHVNRSNDRLDAIERERGRAVVPGWPWLPLVAVLKALPPRFTRPFA